MRRRAIALALPLAALLAACASLPSDKQPLPGETLSGRLALRVDTTGEEQPRSVVAGFELQGVAEAGRLTLKGDPQVVGELWRRAQGALRGQLEALLRAAAPR